MKPLFFLMLYGSVIYCSSASKDGDLLQMNAQSLDISFLYEEERRSRLELLDHQEKVINFLYVLEKLVSERAKRSKIIKKEKKSRTMLQMIHGEIVSRRSIEEELHSSCLYVLRQYEEDRRRCLVQEEFQVHLSATKVLPWLLMVPKKLPLIESKDCLLEPFGNSFCDCSDDVESVKTIESL